MFKCKQLKIFYKDSVLVDISFSFEKSFALVGESGSGKSLTLRAILDLLPSSMRKEMKIESPFPLKRGESVSIVVQNPFTALSPLTKIKDQFFIPKSEALKFMEYVGLDGELLYRFPSELSGGQLQRVIVAMALCVKPKLLLLDEPTTALDSESKERILELVKNLQQKFGFLILFVTHDIDSAAALCEEIAVLKKGKIVEEGYMKDILKNPKKDYTKKLIESNFKNRGFRE